MGVIIATSILQQSIPGRSMGQSLRREIGKDWIRVTSIEPGAVKTEFTSQMRDDVRQAVDADVAAAISFAVTQPPRLNVSNDALSDAASNR